MVLTILVQHADAGLRDMAAAALGGAGMAVVPASDAAEGLAVLERRDIDAILTGINMRGLDGFGFIEAVCRQDRLRGVPILVLSNCSMPELKTRARNAGAAGWLPQPFDPHRLVETVLAVTT